MASVEELATALRNADAAGDVEAARSLASALVAARGSVSPATTSAAVPMPPAPGMLETAARGLAQGGAFNLGDEAFGLGRGTKSWLKGEGFQSGYDRGVQEFRGREKAGSDANPITSAASQIAGALTGGVGLLKSGYSLAGNAIQAGKSLPKVMGASAVEGAALGAVQGAGAGEGVEGRAWGALGGASGGFAIGGAAPAAVAGVSMAAKPLIAPLMARLRPEEYANSAIGTGLRRAGVTADDVRLLLESARADGQDMYTVADAMGNAGQRMLSTATRNPNDARQQVIEALMGRQMDQGGRVAGALQDASGSPLTANQMSQMLTAARRDAATQNYAPVSRDVTAIDISPPVAAANRAISPAADNLALAQGAGPTDLRARAGIEAGEASIRDPIRETVKQARSYLASDSLTVTNVEKAFRAKTNIDQMIADATANNQGARVAALMPIRDSLDTALANTSPQYASARDAYARASRPIDAIETGRGMAAPRSRAQDNLATFGAMDEASQQGARVGFFDPLIGRAEGTAGTMSNAVRPLTSNAMRQQLPVFAQPGQAAPLERRLAREQRMFETASAALGGSKTADNLADAADMAKFDPGIMTNLLQGRPIQAVLAAVSQGKNEAQGLPPRVIERIAQALIETNPAEAARVLSMGADKAAKNDNLRAIANALMNNVGASGAGRLAAP